MIDSNDKEMVEKTFEKSLEKTPLDELKLWIKKNKNYPQKSFNDALLQRFLKVNNNNVKKAQELLTYNLTVRQKAPKLFTNRDILAEEIQIATDVMLFCPMPKLSKDGYKISIGGVHNTDASKFDYVNCMKMILMLFDVRLSEFDCEEQIAEGEIVISDMKGMGWRHLMKSISHLNTAKFHTKFLQEAAPINIVQAHILNPSMVVYRMFKIFKPFMKQELLDVLYFHTSLESLYKYVPKELLPKELGGSEEFSMKDIRSQYIKKMEENREFLLNKDNWTIAIKIDGTDDENDEEN